jgi:hypothetical protein
MEKLRLECIRLAIAAGAGKDAIELAAKIEKFISSSNRVPSS